MLYSPLRYPGGKNKLAKFVDLICKENAISGHYVEPYAGGASVALFLLISGRVSKITINDLDRSIYAFWWSVLNRTEKFCSLVEQTPITVESWYKFREVQRNKEKASLFQLGFATFFLNRTNVSGVLLGGPIGGKNQEGKYKIDCRFNKPDLVARIRKIAEHKKQIEICHLDAMDLVRHIKKSADWQTIIYFDPPYYLKGKFLYTNHYKPFDHEAISKEILKIKNARWIVSYDNAEEIKNMYLDCHKIEYSFFHTARGMKIGEEVLFFSRNLFIPQVSNPAWL